ncbi:hypothetical protein GWI33_016475 [Rhynchophorus ferrugineus]|uniref:Methyltransferase HEMK2 n=1 Tax=Rhynchophorus ferrugineus TaxID=354439 RepID=A0A834MAC4_RHYFE|nr:hypothetical protein GWI33_016475 [Rhynchophorus ferrugineus]
MSLQTPLYNLNDFPDVYEPSEDTHLFIDALEKDMKHIINSKPTLACEIGCGSGVLIAALAKILKSTCCYFCTDINPKACIATTRTAKMNKVPLECTRMDLTTNLKCKFDIILFNPPYVLTEELEIFGCGLNRAFAGGLRGRSVTDRLLNNLNDILSDNGVCYLLLLKENNIGEIGEKMGEKGFKIKLVIQRKIPGEHLFVYKFSKA